MCCGRCNGSGKPENQHKAFHAYLRLAIRTQVINEINKRTRDKTSAANAARREEEAEESEAQAVDASGSGVRIYGARAVAGAELNIHRSLNLPIVDVSATNKEFGWLAPSNALRLTYPQRGMLAGKVSVEGFRVAYRGFLRALLRKNHFADRWRDLLTAIEDGAVRIVTGKHTT